MGEKKTSEFEDAVCRWCKFAPACNTAETYEEFISLSKALVDEGQLLSEDKKVELELKDMEKSLGV